MSAPLPPDPALLERPSECDYAHAVMLSAFFGFLGVQHFYLGRVGEGLLDVGLTAGWLYCFASGAALSGLLLLLLDGAHALLTTIRLLTGNQFDGRGLRVCYPGQRLRPLRID